MKAISAELAASIRREMDLDDLVERLQAQINNPHAPGKRTSDYFSDSGISSAKFSDYDQAKEEIEQIQRRAEQDVAKVRLELTTKLQDERLKRRQLDQQIKELSAKAAQVDLAKIQSVDASGRLKELENTCEQLRRQLAEERQAKDNFEDLLTALRGELQSAANERDNLRDEVVPQLRARVEGLEAQAAENAKLTYEATKMQQELQKLKEENISRGLNGVSSFKLQPPPSAPKPAAKGQVETREQIAERLKDVEAQRDALHNALKSLLERQEFQNRENEKKIRALEQERDRLLAAEPQKASYERQIADLRVEINVLRKRAEEAIDRRCRVEQTVAGLKSDLERAKEEIAMLRRLLSEHDILAPASVSGFGTTASINFAVSGSTSSASLEKAHKELQVAYQESLERIKKLESGGVSDEKTKLAIQRLEQSLASAESERDLARKDLDAQKALAESLQKAEKSHLETEQSLASQLAESTRRVEELASQVRRQLDTNASLRKRLADAAARGEADQEDLRNRVGTLQSRLADLERQVRDAQTAAEERVRRHEDELQAVREANSAQLTRITKDRDRAEADAKKARADRDKAERELREANRKLATATAASTPTSPFFGRDGLKSPRLRNADDSAAQVDMLRKRVAELEKAAFEADREMGEVVARMSSAQMEVARLQEERDTAARETRRLMRIIDEEKMKVFEERFRTLSSPGVK